MREDDRPVGEEELEETVEHAFYPSIHLSSILAAAEATPRSRRKAAAFARVDAVGVSIQANSGRNRDSTRLRRWRAGEGLPLQGAGAPTGGSPNVIPRASASRWAKRRAPASSPSPNAPRLNAGIIVSWTICAAKLSG